MERLLKLGARPASAGEFTARAYLNNKIDLAQAEAVNEVITASNTFQLAAAENLLAGRLGGYQKQFANQFSTFSAGSKQTLISAPKISPKPIKQT